MYFTKKIEEILKELNTTEEGLTTKEAQKRLNENGKNILPKEKRDSIIKIFLRQFTSPIEIILVITVLISFFIGETVDALVIAFIILVDVIMGTFQENKALKSAEALTNMLKIKAKVIRDNEETEMEAEDLVVGDIILLESGTKISADARLIDCYNLQVDESILTGESTSITKDTTILPEDTILAERKNMVYAGCNVTNGHAFVVVCATGMKTELGKIATSLIDKKSDITPLQKKVNQISKILTYVILAIIVVMMIVGLLMKNDFFDVLMLSISLAVAAIPEGMSSIITIILSLGMTAMAKRNVIIRKMASVETLGSTDIICSDKTGTITQNKMIVKSIYVNDKIYNDEKLIPNCDLFKVCASLCHNVTKNNANTIDLNGGIKLYG